MYIDYFGLRHRPFEMSPDARFLFLSDQHDLAIANIKFAIANQDCFVVITGEIGAGKTTILNRVVTSLDQDVVLARLTHTSLTPTELLQAVLLAFDQPIEHDSKVLLFDQIRKFLQKAYAEGKHVIIAVDEAQNLGSPALEELRLLTCIAADSKELLTVVLMGQPTLSDLINSVELQNLRQRTRLRQHLRRLNVEETAKYLEHRIMVAGGKFRKIFKSDTVELIHEATLGTPRLINTLCDTAMTATAIRGDRIVSRECLLEVLDELCWQSMNVVGHVEDQVDASVIATLFIYKFGELLSEVQLSSSLLIVGRDKSNHLQLNDKSVGRRHAIIAMEHGEFGIEDLGSVNGTYLNDRKCVRHATVLRNNDRITIGHYSIVFCNSSDVRKEKDSKVADEDGVTNSTELPNIELSTTTS